MSKCFHAYQESLRIWEDIAEANPSLMGIPRALLEDQSELSQKKVARMKRNFGFDRARYFLPVAAATNVMLIMSARGWVNLCQYLLSQDLPEPQRLGELIRKELEMVAPPHGQTCQTHGTSQKCDGERDFKKAGSACKGRTIS